MGSSRERGCGFFLTWKGFWSVGVREGGVGCLGPELGLGRFPGG